ncbi:MAG: hypothetical protein WA896_13755 [Spirulinaceae cyanobacterium]
MAKNITTKSRKSYLPIISTLLILSGNLQLILPALADPDTAAGTKIDNTATATYNDPNDPSAKLTSKSNKVTVEVAEIAGITVKASGIAKQDGSTTPIAKNDELYYTYTVTNVGNDTTKFRIPNTANLTGPGIISGSLEVNYNDGNGWHAITAGSLDTTPLAPRGSILVRVPITVDSSPQSGDTINVQLGNTPGNSQNQDFITNGGDVYTVDAADGTIGETPGAPANGVREASDTQGIKVGDAAKNQPLVTIEKTRSEYLPGDSSIITDDRITYDLKFRVEQNDPTTGGFIPAPLLPLSNINIDGTPEKHILVSDAIPAGTVLTGLTTAPTGWTAVYTLDDPATTPYDDATKARWVTTVPGGNFSAVKRVGFINNNSVASVGPGTTVQTFRVQVLTSNVPGNSATIANIAQVFGASDSAGTVPVVDESGDQTPSNYNETAGAFDPATDGYLPDGNGDGQPDELGTVGTDPGNNNTGTGTAGEANILPLGIAKVYDLLNGPDNAPGATGPNSNNDDFTNKSAILPSAKATPGSTYDPGPVNFTNTIINNGQTKGNITIEPSPLANPNDLPNGTKVTIISPLGATATYTYDQVNNTFTTTGTPIVVPNVAPNQQFNYGVEIDLPNNTSLSTDAASGDNEPGYPVPLTATISNGGAVLNKNTTIDRVYTGYLKLTKLSRILQGDGELVKAGQGDFNSTPTDANGNDPNSTVADVLRTPSSGNIIEYKVIYKNISEPPAGSGNVSLKADNIVITEDGVTAPNNWALDNDNNSEIDTSNIVGSASDSRGGNISYFSGSPASTSTIDQSGVTVNNDVTKYIDKVTGLLEPQKEGFLIFRRRVN